MAVLPILLFGNPVLRQKARKVTRIDGSIRKLIDDMIETMHNVSGVGIAAPQVGTSLQVIVIEPPDQEEGEEDVLVLINPVLIKKKGERIVQEGCLSLPGYRGEIKRAVTVTVKGRDRQGRGIRVRWEGLLAQTLEHELDHLNGVLYTDHLESMDKLYKIEPKEGAEPEEGREKPEAAAMTAG